MISNLETSARCSKASVFQLKVVLLGTTPSIWRRLQMPGEAGLDWVHAVLQVAMGWTNSHLHHFITSDARYCDLQDNEDIGFGPKPDRDERKATLASVLPKKGARIVYEYDFGDSWRHEVKLEKILPPSAGRGKLPVCIAGARACPPEDCGGIWGYANLLKVLKCRDHPERRQVLEWLGGPIDPEFFNLTNTNVWLRKLKWPRVTDAHLRKVLMGRDYYQE